MTWAISLHCVVVPFWLFPATQDTARHPKEFYGVNIKVAAGLSVSCLMKRLKSTGIYGLQLHPSNFCFPDYLAFLPVLKTPSASLFYKYLWLHFTPTWKIQHSLSISRFLPASPLRGPFAVEGAIDSWQWLWPGDLGGRYSDYHQTQDAPRLPPAPPWGLLAHRKHSVCPSIADMPRVLNGSET